jgi:hypothetical protein
MPLSYCPATGEGFPLRWRAAGSCLAVIFRSRRRPRCAPPLPNDTSFEVSSPSSRYRLQSDERDGVKTGPRCTMAQPRQSKGNPQASPGTDTGGTTSYRLTHAVDGTAPRVARRRWDDEVENRVDGRGSRPGIRLRPQHRILRAVADDTADFESRRRLIGTPVPSVRQAELSSIDDDNGGHVKNSP